MNLFFGLDHGLISVQVASEDAGPDDATAEQMRMMVEALNHPPIKQAIKDRLLHRSNQEIDITNGPHGESIGHLPGPNGTLVPLYGSTPLDWLDALVRCVGDPPQPHEVGLSGGLVSVVDQKGFVTGYTYDPSADEANKEEIAVFQGKLQAWSARTELVKQAFENLFKK